jgi:hypothetical protein
MGLTDVLVGLTGRKAPKTGNPLMDTLSPGGSLPTGNLGKIMMGLDLDSIPCK